MAWSDPGRPDGRLGERPGGEVWVGEVVAVEGEGEVLELDDTFLEGERVSCMDGPLGGAERCRTVRGVRAGVVWGDGTATLGDGRVPSVAGTDVAADAWPVELVDGTEGFELDRSGMWRELWLSPSPLPPPSSPLRMVIWMCGLSKTNFMTLFRFG